MAVKHPIALVRQMDVQILGGNAILRALDAVGQVAVLVADEDVVGLFLGGLFHPFLADTLYVLGLAGIVLLCLLIGVFQRLLIICIRQHAFDGGGVAGGDPPPVVVLLIFDAVAGHQTPPISVGILGVFTHDIVKGLLRLVKLGQAKLLRGGIQEGNFLGGYFLRLIRAAASTDPPTAAVFVIAAAVVTHGLIHDFLHTNVFDYSFT